MGIGGALIMPATLSIITNVFTDRKERAQAIAIWSATAGVAVAIGPVTGGWLLEHFWWGSVFLVNVPVVVVALVLGQLFVPTSRDPAAPPLDLPGAVLSIAGLVALVWAIIEGAHGWTDPQVLGAFAVAAVLLDGVRRVGAAHAAPDARHELLRATPGSARPAARSCSRSSPCSARCSCSPSSCSRCSATRRCEAGIRLLPMAAVQMVRGAAVGARWSSGSARKVVVATGLLIGGRRPAARQPARRAERQLRARCSSRWSCWPPAWRW